MRTIHIKFNTREDQIRGFYELATRSRVTSLRNAIYAAPIESLRLLDEQQISYRRATDEEVEAASGQVRTPIAALL